MIERHYFKQTVIQAYEFEFGFIMPGSTNSWEYIYDLPQLSEADKKEMRSTPWAVTSDTFFFADGKLIVHNKAEYNYASIEEDFEEF